VAEKNKELLTFDNLFCEGKDPFENVEWDERDAEIKDSGGNVVFSLKDVAVPKSWSQMATNIVANQYFAGTPGHESSETSVRVMVDRITTAISDWGVKGNYFNKKQGIIFKNELVAILLNQRASFNSPVWYNVGVEASPQSSACFIQPVEDSMEGLLALQQSESMLFKWGSGTGTNLSPLRSSREYVSGGGLASGPVSFMLGYDAWAGVIKSGGKTRRAAKMQILDADHPDIKEFIRCKVEAEEQAHALIEQGYSAEFNIPGNAYERVPYQNSNTSVRVSDDFMRIVETDGIWTTRFRTNKGKGDPPKYRAKELFKEIAESTWFCGDPGIQFDTTINNWHTCPSAGRINASNPCVEFMFLDNSACNLASINLLKFWQDGKLDSRAFCHTIDIIVTAMEILVDNAGYPTKPIGRNSKRFRPLGLGYTNLGAYMMSCGLPYDSDRARTYASAITGLMTAEGYLQSAKIAGVLSPFPGYNHNDMMTIIRKHETEMDRHAEEGCVLSRATITHAINKWKKVVELGEEFGFRNAQVSLLAPTGTISFMMDCDTTGIEPDIALVKVKKLVGTGIQKLVNNSVRRALNTLGYSTEEIDSIQQYILEKGHIEGCPQLQESDTTVFDCALKAGNGRRMIAPLGHIRMMAAVQPFISGAISKTVNVPREIIADEIASIYMQAWKMGLKAIAIYREGSKKTQPMNTGAEEESSPEKLKVRRKLPSTCFGPHHRFRINNHKGYVMVGEFEDGSPGEIFVVMSKQGSTVNGLMDTIATLTSISLQYGVPLGVLVDKFAHVRFEPAGWTDDANIKIAKSITDYIFRWLGHRYLTNVEHIGELEPDLGDQDHATETDQNAAAKTDAPTCWFCGSITYRSGTCYQCPDCGETSGCS